MNWSFIMFGWCRVELVYMAFYLMIVCLGCVFIVCVFVMCLLRIIVIF